MVKLLLAFALCCVLVHKVAGHGRLDDPPHRGTLWRHPEYQWANPGHLPDDTELHCGGEQLILRSVGACGLCGDPITAPMPRPHEIGGEFERGIIVRRYTVGQTVDVTMHVQAVHRGWHEMRICNYSETGIEDEACFRENVLRFGDGAGETRVWDIDQSTGPMTFQIRLPEGLRCERCVLQWQWQADNGQFYRNCVDIAIE